MLKRILDRIPVFRKVQLPWLAVGLLAVSCIILAVIQNRWIYQLSAAERERLHNALRSDLENLSRDFDSAIAASATALTPSFEDVSTLGSLTACSNQYERWKENNDAAFSRIWLLLWKDPAPVLYLLDKDTGAFSPVEWPSDWTEIQRSFENQHHGRSHSETGPGNSSLVRIGLFGSRHHGPERVEGPAQQDNHQGEPPDEGREDWLVVEVSADYVRSTLLPELLIKDLGSSGAAVYDAKVVSSANPAIAILNVGGTIRDPEGSVGLLDPGRLEVQHRQGGGRERRPGPPRNSRDMTDAAWRLLVQHHGRSLDASVTSARVRNVVLSGGILLLILGMVFTSLRYARRSQQIAELQMNFVAGVSHELRTPLTVIRTAAYNLRGRVASRPDQVERYGQLIQNESEKLSILVDQVLRYGAVTSGRVIGERRPVEIHRLIESSIETSSARAGQAGLIVEKRLDADLPLILADELALRHALQNLMDNAVKYGLEGNNWIGVFAEAVPANGEELIEIRVADRGPGIPAEEQSHLFDAFFRGRRALDDQIHGTGLGLNLVKSIIEAHGGTIRVSSGPSRGAEFIIRIPAAPREVQDVFANTIS